MGGAALSAGKFKYWSGQILPGFLPVEFSKSFLYRASLKVM